MLFLDGIMEVLKAFDDWQIKEEGDGRIVIGSEGFTGFTQNSDYVFYRNRDIFSRSIIQDDNDVYRRVCVYNYDFLNTMYKDVECYTGWNLQNQKTLYVQVPDGTTEEDAINYLNQVAERLKYVGKIESFTGPFRPQLLVGDGAIIIDEEGEKNLDLITEITHRFGKDGFYTDFTVDSGGRLGKGRLSDYIGKINKRIKRNQETSRMYE